MNHVLSPEELAAGQAAERAIKSRGVSPCPSLATLPTTQEELEDWYVKWFPRGSGPLNAMRIICQLLEEVSAARGYTTNFTVLRAEHNLKVPRY